MAAAEIDPARKGASLAMLLAVVAVLTAMAAGGGWWLSGILPIVPSAALAPAKPPAPAPAADEAPAPAAGGQVVKLEPILVTLAAPDNVWIRIEAALVASPGASIAPDMAAAVQGDFAAYLSALSLQQIAGATGLQYLREDLEERARLRSDGKVAEVIISSLVME